MCGHPSSGTHSIRGVDVGLGFANYDDTVGVSIDGSPQQRRTINLRTHNDTESQSKYAGTPPLTRT